MKVIGVKELKGVSFGLGYLLLLKIFGFVSFNAWLWLLVFVVNAGVSLIWHAVKLSVEKVEQDKL